MFTTERKYRCGKRVFYYMSFINNPFRYILFEGKIVKKLANNEYSIKCIDILEHDMYIKSLQGFRLHLINDKGNQLALKISKECNTKFFILNIFADRMYKCVVPSFNIFESKDVLLENVLSDHIQKFVKETLNKYQKDTEEQEKRLLKNI